MIEISIIKILRFFSDHSTILIHKANLGYTVIIIINPCNYTVFLIITAIYQATKDKDKTIVEEGKEKETRGETRMEDCNRQRGWWQFALGAESTADI